MNLYQYAPSAWNWIDPWGLACASSYSGRRGMAKARADLKKNNFKIVHEEVTMKVNGQRIRADIVAKDTNGKYHVFEVKNGTGRLTKGQAKSGVYDISNPSNTHGGYGGGIVRGNNGTKGSFEVATGNSGINSTIGQRGTVINDATFHVLRY